MTWFSEKLMCMTKRVYHIQQSWRQFCDILATASKIISTYNSVSCVSDLDENHLKPKYMVNIKIFSLKSDTGSTGMGTRRATYEERDRSDTRFYVKYHFY